MSDWSQLWIDSSFCSYVKKQPEQISLNPSGSLNKQNSTPKKSNKNYRIQNESKPKSLKRSFTNDDCTSIYKLSPKKPISLKELDPTSSNDLAVSKQKLNELRNWFINYFGLTKVHSANDTHSKSHFLLLNGPSGSGKTISVKVLAKELEVKVVELPTTSIFNEQDFIVDNLKDLSIRNNHLNITEDHTENLHDKIRSVSSESQLNRFKRFLYDLNYYKKTVLNDYDYRENKIIRPKSVLLIEDIPNIFLLKPELLHDELDLLYKKFKSRIVPIIFIISETINGINIEQKVLPKAIQSKLNFNVITFKSISNTCLTKALSKTPIGKNLNKADIEEIVLSCSGDIRNAFNYLLFKYLNNHNKYNFSSTKLFSKKIKLSLEKVKSRDNKDISKSNSDICGRIEPLNLIHAVAKILYAKRCKTPDPFILDFLKKYSSFDRDLLRDPLIEERPESIAERSNASCDTFSEWIHENFCDFIVDNHNLTNVVDCLQILSDVNSIYKDYDSRETIESFRISYLIRGIMFYINDDNSCYKQIVSFNEENKKSNHSFRALKPSKSYRILNQTNENLSYLDELKTTIHEEIFVRENDTNLILDILPCSNYIPYLQKGISELNLLKQVNFLCDLDSSSEKSYKIFRKDTCVRNDTFGDDERKCLPYLEKSNDSSLKMPSTSYLMPKPKSYNINEIDSDTIEDDSD